MKNLLTLLVWVALACMAGDIQAQKNYVSVTSLLNRTDAKLKNIESNPDRFIEKTMVDILFKGISADTRNSFNHAFADNENYILTILGDPDRLVNMTVNISLFQNERWTVVKTEKRWLTDFTMNFTPQTSGSYKVEVIGEFKNNTDYSHYAVLIDKQM